MCRLFFTSRPGDPSHGCAGQLEEGEQQVNPTNEQINQSLAPELVDAVFASYDESLGDPNAVVAEGDKDQVHGIESVNDGRWNYWGEVV